MFRWLLVSAFVLTPAFGQEEAAIQNHPHHLGLVYKGHRVCGASLIKYNIALTAQQCTFQRQLSDLAVIGGTNCTDCERNKGVLFEVLSKCEHKNYDSSTKDYDVSILFLTPVDTYPISMQPISLQPRGSEISPGTLGNVAGWGFYDSSGDELKSLQKVGVVKIGQTPCKDIYDNKMISDRMACHTVRGPSTCRGEFGSALVIQEKQVGIASWGIKGVCGDNRYPTVYTKLSDPDIADFITNCMSTFVP